MKDALIGDAYAWVGEIPDQWEFRRLGSCFTERRATTTGELAPPLSVTKSGVIEQQEHVAKSVAGAPKKVVHSGDLVINSRSDRKGSAGLAPRFGSVSLINIVLQPTGIHPQFAFFLLRSTAFQEEFFRHGSGIVDDLWTTRYADAKTIKLPIPPLSVQKNIAEFLDHETAEIDGFIADQGRLIELLEERRAATITHAVTKGLDPKAPMKDSGIQWIRETPTHWTVVPLRRVASVVNGGTPTQNETNWGGSIPWATPVDLNHFDGTTISSTGRTLTKQGLLTGSATVPAGSVLLSTRAPVGYVSRTTSSIAFNQGCKGVVPRREYLNTIFLMYALIAAKAELTVRSQGTTFLELSTNALLGIPFPIPMVEEQHDIVDFLDREISDIDAAISDAQEAIALSKERRAALISAAVTGQIDVTKKPSRESTGEVLDEEVPV